ncbi:hypothetical protein BV20DRAFT_1035959 [Pilatotrama ljubarskyi]|nr:hypothetical protein BV20DRAFT_1035959 [Pilatotrama ljubarskyi]
MAKKKGPPYTDDPGCKYIVIEDPWPGNPTGNLKARNQVYFNHLCTWVYFMLGKAHEAEAVFSVNTRSEVILRLPETVDLTPILGAHPWRKFLSRGDAKDKDRVSYVFEYNYRLKGEPASHSWVETYPSVSGDPPPHLRFPVVFPYPHVSWASPKGKNCADLALPLPATRQPTPVPDTSGFVPYQHPSQLTAGTVDNARPRPDQASETEHKPKGKLGKIDPYEEESNALRSLRSESLDVHAPVKQEGSDARVKGDPGEPVVKHEFELYGPSKSFRNTVERLQQARNSSQGEQVPSADSRSPTIKEEVPAGPSPSFVEAFQRIRGRPAEAGTSLTSTDPRVEQDTSEEPVSAPSDSFRAAFERIRGVRAAPGDEVAYPGRSSASSPDTIRAQEMRFKPEPGERKRFKSEAMY